ncbi:MAG: FAD-dependent oxidoreductase [Steroidobacteraceae bacterium]
MPIVDSVIEGPPKGPYDVAVVGSGAAALLAACHAHDLGASVVVLEKTNFLGGTSAMSGGALWIPNNGLMAEAGIEDSEQEAFAYLRSVIPAGQVADHTLLTYLRTAPRMVEYLQSIGVPYHPVALYRDYYPAVPGWKQGGRTMDCEPLDGRRLGRHLDLLRQGPPASRFLSRINLSITEVAAIQAVVPGWRSLALGALLRYGSDLIGRFRGSRDRRLCLGEALVGRLLLAALARDIPVHIKAPVSELLLDTEGRVGGVSVEDPAGSQHAVTARRAVVVASGGFERSPTLRGQHLAQPTHPDWSAGSPGNTGDMLRAAEQVGAATALMGEAWWAPVVMWKGQPIVLFFEKSKPGLMIVDQRGQRFMNESITYNSYGRCIYGQDYQRSDRVPAYVIFDRTYRERYLFGGLLQASLSPDWLNPGAFGEGAMLRKAPTLRALASELGIDADGLEAPANRLGNFARSGIDLDFGRGADAHDRQYGDASVQPNPCLGPIEKPPFYGAPLYPGDIGTKGGLCIDDDARVLDERGLAIPGLFAAGNCSASIMGDTYPGAGCTLGPALTMAYRASHAAMQPA